MFDKESNYFERNVCHLCVEVTGAGGWPGFVVLGQGLGVLCEFRFIDEFTIWFSLDV